MKPKSKLTYYAHVDNLNDSIFTFHLNIPAMDKIPRFWRVSVCHY